MAHGVYIKLQADVLSL